MSDPQNLRAGRRISTDELHQAVPQSMEAGKRIEQALENSSSDAEQGAFNERDALEQELEHTFKPKRTFLTIKKLLLISLVVLVAAEAIYGVIEAFTQSWLLGGLYILVLSLGLVALIRFLFSEYRALKSLSTREHMQSDAQRLLSSTQIGEAQQWLAPLLEQHNPDGVQEFKATIKAHHTDREVLELYQNTLLNTQDQQAKAIINTHATTSAMLVALSPMALLDMLAVLWRGVHLVEKLSQHYGIRLGYRSRITLYKLLLKQMVFAGAAELVSDLAATSMGAELLSKLSARAAQGLSAGVFTARLGYKAMELCRPLPKLADKPNLLQGSIEQIFKALLNRSK
ncbi:putative membrane protein [Pseudoalteromonas citrea]|uniref:Membrane protein n=2 Tax=Pseudoalteromonas citrea TaxID=43655 RepID=A0AAD4AM88_9GAMM|nr:TIGR01620 family protein [Pseudoalteromonas citrea]KAF7775312.1 putative membrane protein [Pseudoalteromonas citrea]